MFGWISPRTWTVIADAHHRTTTILLEQIRDERAMNARLIGELVALRREGFAPATAEPDVATSLGYPEGWESVVAACAERSGGRSDLERTMRANALAWLRGGMALKEVVARIYSGWGGAES